MNLYEVKNVETGQVIASAVLIKEASKLLDCPTYAVSNAYHSNYAIHGKYRINQIDTTITKRDPIWHKWDLYRNMILKSGRRK